MKGEHHRVGEPGVAQGRAEQLGPDDLVDQPDGAR